MASRAISQLRVIGVGLALLIVVLTYTPAGLGSGGRAWAAAVMLGVGLVLGDSFQLLRVGVGTPGVVPAALLAVLLAMYLCVPETDQFVVAVLVPFGVLVVELVKREQLGLEWYAVAAVGVAWAGMFGSSGRESALIGALFAWWPLLLPWLTSRLDASPSRPSLIATAAIGAGAAILVARTGGISDSAGNAAITVVVVAFASSAVAWGATRLGRRRVSNAE